MSGFGDGVMGIPSAEDILVRFSSLPITRCLLRLYRRWSPGRLREVFGAAPRGAQCMKGWEEVEAYGVS